jgi:hypothetical protein
MMMKVVDITSSYGMMTILLQNLRRAILQEILGKCFVLIDSVRKAPILTPSSFSHQPLSIDQKIALAVCIVLGAIIFGLVLAWILSPAFLAGTINMFAYCGLAGCVTWFCCQGHCWCNVGKAEEIRAEKRKFSQHILDSDSDSDPNGRHKMAYPGPK